MPINATTLKTRSIHFAFLFGPPRQVARALASQVHNEVCTRLGMDDLSFKFEKREPKVLGGRAQSPGFAILIERSEGTGKLAVQVDNDGGHAPIRLLLTETWPQAAVQITKERFDEASAGVFEQLDTLGEWTRILAEVRLRAQCGVGGGTALDLFQGEILCGNTAKWTEILSSPPNFFGIQLEVPPQAPKEVEPLHGPKREVQVQVLRDDARAVYIESVSTWLQVASPELLAGGFDPRTLRRIDAQPSAYIEDAYAFTANFARSLQKLKE